MIVFYFVLLVLTGLTVAMMFYRFRYKSYES